MIILPIMFYAVIGVIFTYVTYQPHTVSIWTSGVMVGVSVGFFAEEFGKWINKKIKEN